MEDFSMEGQNYGGWDLFKYLFKCHKDGKLK
jgi:hypothetical protein